MRIFGLILIIAGAVLIFFNLIADLTEPAYKQANAALKVTYYVGFNFIAIVGAVLLFIGIQTRRRAKRKSGKALIDTLLESESKQLLPFPLYLHPRYLKN